MPFMVKNIYYIRMHIYMLGLPSDSVDKDSACQCRRHRRCWFYLWVRKRAKQPTAGFLPGESHGQRSLMDHSL